MGRAEGARASAFVVLQGEQTKGHRQDANPSSEVLGEQVRSNWSGCKQSTGDSFKNRFSL